MDRCAAILMCIGGMGKAKWGTEELISYIWSNVLVIKGYRSVKLCLLGFESVSFLMLWISLNVAVICPRL